MFTKPDGWVVSAAGLPNLGSAAGVLSGPGRVHLRLAGACGGKEANGTGCGPGSARILDAVRKLARQTVSSSNETFHVAAAKQYP